MIRPRKTAKSRPRPSKAADPADPKAWRVGAGKGLTEIARAVGLGGKNPARTYDRYEKGEQECPAEVVEAVRQMSGGIVGAESWLRARMAYRASAGAQHA